MHGDGGVVTRATRKFSEAMGAGGTDEILRMRCEEIIRGDAIMYVLVRQ